MSSFSIRPRVSQVLDLEVDEAQERIIQEVRRVDDQCELKIFPRFLCLRIPESERHFWSPRLHLAIDPTEDGRTRLVGTYGPNANVWALFLYGYLFTGSAGLFAGIFGYAQWQMDTTPWGLWIAAAMVAAVGGLYLLAQFGQKIGAAQTFRLHHNLDTALQRTLEIR